MNELERLHSALRKKQIGMLVFGFLSEIAATFLIGDFLYQEGFMDCEKQVNKYFPDLYKGITQLESKKHSRKES